MNFMHQTFVDIKISTRSTLSGCFFGGVPTTQSMPQESVFVHQQHQNDGLLTHYQQAPYTNYNYYDYALSSSSVTAAAIAAQQNASLSRNQCLNKGQIDDVAPGNMASSYAPSPSLNASASLPSSHHVTASVNDPCAQIAHVLQCYQAGNEDADYVRKAIESLVKKLKGKGLELENLISAITSAGKQPTSCVTIQRSLDGRLQVAGRKGVPHVVYARIWRWPDVTKNELRKLPNCTLSSDDQDVICINPYHYERIVSSKLAKIDVGSMRLDVRATTLSSSGLQNASSSCSSIVQVPLNRLHSEQQIAPLSSHQNVYSSQPFPSNSSVQLNCMVEDTGNSIWTSNGQYRSSLQNSAASSIEPNVSYQMLESNNGYVEKQLRYDLNAVQLPQTASPHHWCSINYYELDSQVGESFKVRREQTEVIIDGGVDPMGAKHGRFCLGALSNVHRCEASEKARLHIGKGVRISTYSDGSVYLECLSHKSVYVRSYYLDFEHDMEYGLTVHKFCSGAPNRKIFDLRWAYAEMEQQSESARIAVVAQAAAVAGYASTASLNPSLIEHAGTGMDDLRRVCCTIAISFVKGWGSGYNRTSIKETPCWIELQLHRPLQYLDQLLKRNYDYFDD